MQFALDLYSKFDIKPVPKPRMTKSDRWKKRACVERYWSFKDEIRASEMVIPEQEYHAIFQVAMPKSWSKKKKALMLGQKHQQKPDKDNFEKALLDAVFDDDSKIWDGRVSKIWGETGAIYLGSIKDSIQEV